MERVREIIILNCFYCKKEFSKLLHHYKNQNKNHISKNFCSIICQSKFRTTKQEVECKQCKTKFLKKLSQVKYSPSHFCSHSCNATYQNTHKTYGTRVSKFEKHVQKQLLSTYPELEFHFNRKDAINSELDVFIPELKLAFEINGIFHYKPVFGEKHFLKVQKNDQFKVDTCIENNISLHIFDISGIGNFKPEKATPFLKKMEEIIAQARTKA